MADYLNVFLAVCEMQITFLPEDDSVQQFSSCCFLFRDISRTVWVICNCGEEQRFVNWAAVEMMNA